MPSTPVRADPAACLLVVEGLTVDFVDAGNGTRNRVVDSVDFSIARGERYALVGESGSGKTAIAQAIMRLHHNAEYGGSVRFAGKELMTASEREMRAIRGRDIAMIFQEPMSALNPLYSIGNQIVEVLERDPGVVQSFESVRGAVALALGQQVYVSALRQFLQLLAGEADIVGVELDAAHSPLVQ